MKSFLLGFSHTLRKLKTKLKPEYWLRTRGDASGKGLAPQWGWMQKGERELTTVLSLRRPLSTPRPFTSTIACSLSTPPALPLPVFPAPLPLPSGRSPA